MTSVQALLDDAQAQLLRGDTASAIAAHERLLRQRPDLADHWYNLGYLLQRARRYADALTAYDEALRRGASGPEEIQLNRCAVLAQHLARPEDAEAALKEALTHRPGWLPALLNLGNLYEQRGQRRLAIRAYEQVLATQPDHALALARLSGLQDAGEPLNLIIARLEQAICSSGRPPSEQADLGFALGRALDSAGAYDRAMEAFKLANEACRLSEISGTPRYDREEQERFVDRMIALFPGSPALCSPLLEQAGSTPKRVFICGLFRSGSSLVEQILASHPLVSAGGELEMMPALAGHAWDVCERTGQLPPLETLKAMRDAYVRETHRLYPDAAVLTDKRVDNFLHIGFVLTLFPDARIVHTLRDPLDNVLSMYFLHLGPQFSYALDLADAGHWYAQHLRLMAHWKRVFSGRILTLIYESLVREPRTQIEALLAHVGLPWHEGCSSFDRTNTVVRTPSTWQVREPLHARAIGRWRHYEKHLGPLRTALENQADVG